MEMVAAYGVTVPHARARTHTHSFSLARAPTPGNVLFIRGESHSLRFSAVSISHFKKKARKKNISAALRRQALLEAAGTQPVNCKIAKKKKY